MFPYGFTCIHTISKVLAARVKFNVYWWPSCGRRSSSAPINSIFIFNLKSVPSSYVDNRTTIFNHRLRGYGMEEKGRGVGEGTQTISPIQEKGMRVNGKSQILPIHAEIIHSSYIKQLPFRTTFILAIEMSVISHSNERNHLLFIILYGWLILEGREERRAWRRGPRRGAVGKGEATHTRVLLTFKQLWTLAAVAFGFPNSTPPGRQCTHPTLARPWGGHPSIRPCCGGGPGPHPMCCHSFHVHTHTFSFFSNLARLWILFHCFFVRPNWIGIGIQILIERSGIELGKKIIFFNHNVILFVALKFRFYFEIFLIRVIFKVS